MTDIIQINKQFENEFRNYINIMDEKLTKFIWYKCYKLMAFEIELTKQNTLIQGKIEKIL